MLLAAIVLFVVVIPLLTCLVFRTVVPTNFIDIVQRNRDTVSYGSQTAGGTKNVYMAWPASLPLIGVRVTRLPISVFRLQLVDYAAYDKGRVPFMIDVIAFFRVFDSGMAAQRVSSIKELNDQLDFILKGAMRSILASSEIEEILEGRSKFGERFTQEVDEQLREWGVRNVKAIELMDIRDAPGSQVIANIMAKKQSLIERESRVAVADNKRAAKVAEVEAGQAVEVRQREAEQLIGQRAAERDKQIGIAQQLAQQAIKEQERETAIRAMAVLEVNRVRQSEIDRASQLVQADQAKQVKIIEAEAKKSATITIADGDLESAKRNAQAVEVEGRAKGEAQTAVLMAPVNAKISLAREIGQNEGYQHYLATIKAIDKDRIVGIEQAKALAEAEIKVIANAGSPVEGVKSAMELFSSKGGTQLGAMLEGFKNTEAGKAVIDAVTKHNGEASA